MKTFLVLNHFSQEEKIDLRYINNVFKYFFKHKFDKSIVSDPVIGVRLFVLIDPGGGSDRIICTTRDRIKCTTLSPCKTIVPSSTEGGTNAKGNTSGNQAHDQTTAQRRVVQKANSQRVGHSSLHSREISGD
jgi:hypothetical protein